MRRLLLFVLIIFFFLLAIVIPFSAANYYIIVNETTTTTTSEKNNNINHFDVSSSKIQQQHPRIVGGSDTMQGEFPFIASWFWGTFQSPPGCAGSLVAPNLVLTAAHCEPITGRIVIGSQYRNPYAASSNPNIAIRRVIRKIVHPQYDPTRNFYDYLILELEEEVNIEDFPPLLLNFDYRRPYVGEPLTAIGYGLTSEGGQPARLLQKVQVPALSRQQCRTVYQDGLVRGDIHLCAGGEEEGRDGCIGDSGGPLMRFDPFFDHQWYQVGIVSWGVGCARAEYPGVYARLSGAKPWLMETICRESSLPQPSYCSTNNSTTTTTTPAPVPRVVISNGSSTPVPTTKEPTTKAPILTKEPTPSPITLLSPTKAPKAPPLRRTPVPTTPVPTTPSPILSITGITPPTLPPTPCKSSCTNVEIFWMIQQNEPCTSFSKNRLSRWCNQNIHWRNNNICEFSCSIAGYGYNNNNNNNNNYDDEYYQECCNPDQFTLAQDHGVPQPIDWTEINPALLIDSGSNCRLCNDVATPWMKSVGNECPSSYLIPTKCNKSTAWRIFKYCRFSCFEAGYGYEGDQCCTVDDIIISQPTIIMEAETPPPTTTAVPATTSSSVVTTTTTTTMTTRPITVAPATTTTTTTTTTITTPTTTTSSPIPASCVECTDIGNSWMRHQNIPCRLDYILIRRKCNRNAVWRYEKSCQYTCYLSGYGYEGDVCCLRDEDGHV